MPTSYYEIVVRGDKKVLRGFVAGFVAAKHSRGAMMCKGLPIDTHHLSEVLHGHTDYEHLICTGPNRRSFLSAIERVGGEMDVELISDEQISRAWFSFRFETFNRKVARGVKRILARPPAGITFVDIDSREDIDPSSKGVEMYSPAHDYRLEGTGVAEGDVAKLLVLHRKLDEHEFIDVKDIQLDH